MSDVVFVELHLRGVRVLKVLVDNAHHLVMGPTQECEAESRLLPERSSALGFCNVLTISLRHQLASRASSGG